MFEEASGITKFKADKKEALRKLDHTEVNLQRLDDIIREVRRQIISLQRQAGKAKRYKTMQDQLRQYDLFFTRGRLIVFDRDIDLLETKLAKLHEQDEAVYADVQCMEQGGTEHRRAIQEMEQNIAEVMEAVAVVRSEWERSNELIRINKERIQEMNALSERESRDANEAQQRLAGHRDTLASMEREIATAIEKRDVVDHDLKVEAEKLTTQATRVETSGQLLHDLRHELVDLESRSAKIQNELSDLEAQERTTIIRRERLAAEKLDLQHVVETFQERKASMASRLQGLEEEAVRQQQRVDTLMVDRSAREEKIGQSRERQSLLKSEMAAKLAQIELLEKSESDSEGFPGGARLLLDTNRPIAFDRKKLLGTLAEQVQPEEEYRIAFEVAARAWLDAVLFEDDRDAVDLLKELRVRSEGSARLLAVSMDTELWEPSESDVGVALSHHVQCDPELRPLVSRLLQGVFVVDDLSELGQCVDENLTLVTRDGCLRRGDGRVEYWVPSEQDANPMARQHLLRSWRKELAKLEIELDATQQHLTDLQDDETALKEKLKEQRHGLQQSQQRVAELRGEQQVVLQEFNQANERFETVTYELNALMEQNSSCEQQRGQSLAALEQIRARQTEVRTTIAEQTNQHRSQEQERSELSRHVTELRINYVEYSQHVDVLLSQKDSLHARIEEQESLLKGRESGLSGYRSRIAQLTQEMNEAGEKLQPLQDDVEKFEGQLSDLRQRQKDRREEQENNERNLQEKADEPRRYSKCSF